MTGQLPDFMPADLNEQVQLLARDVNKLIRDVEYLRTLYYKSRDALETLGLDVNKLLLKKRGMA
jgi:hypothetical protein